jgi:hypothetical protein
MPEFMEVFKDSEWAGYTAPHGAALNEAAMTRAIELISNSAGMPTYRQQYLLREAITTADFPNLFGGVLDRQLLAMYRAAVSPWRSFIPTGTLNDFRVADLEKLSGNQQLLGLVPEKSEYPTSAMAEGHYHRQLFKRGRKFDISWEAIINDALGAFSDMAVRFSNAATYTEAWLATSLYASATGPRAALFGAPVVDAADGANVTNLGALPLTAANLATTLGLMASQVDVQGMPLGIRGMHLVVPPMLEFTARSILTSTTILPAAGAPVTNIIPQMGLQLHVDPMIPAIDVSGTVNVTWYLFADPADGKWGQVDFLRGHESPEICMKSSNKVSVGGLSIDPFGGDFDTDDILWRVRHCLGASVLDPRFAYAQA